MYTTIIDGIKPGEVYPNDVVTLKIALHFLNEPMKKWNENRYKKTSGLSTRRFKMLIK